MNIPAAIPADTLPHGLVRYNAACAAVAAAKSTDEAKDWRDRAEAMRAYAHQSKNRQLEIDAAEIRIRAERRLGQLIAEQKATVGLNRGLAGSIVSGADREPVRDERPTLSDIGVDKKLSAHSQKVAAIPEAEFEDIVADWRDTLETENERVSTNILAAAEKATAKPHVAHNTGNNEWYTPDDILAAARDVMGGIWLDPASSEIANRRVGATIYFDKDDDGLRQSWTGGTIWMNPPYAPELVRQFADKLVETVESYPTIAIVLVNNATETRWFQRMAGVCRAICFPVGRVRFLDPDGNPGAPLQGQAILYFGFDPDGFCERFADFGFVVRHG